ncbi:MAG: hypothetical protein AAF203_08980, partial [Pseudomonadota bacterium]
PNQDGTFRALLDPTFNGELEARPFKECNTNIPVQFNEDGLPELNKVTLVQLGARAYATGQLHYSKSAAFFSGDLWKAGAPEKRDMFEVHYQRLPSPSLEPTDSQ